MTRNSIVFDNVSYHFGKKEIFKNLSFEVPAGQTVGIMGPSGTGKTTLLRLMGGQIQPDTGKVFVEGKDLKKIKRTELFELRKCLGMLFQSGALFSDLTVFENVAFPLRMFTKMSEVEVIERVNFCLNRVNILNKNSLYPSEISGGMQKRVAIARAISMKPKYLFCDEPNSGLDPVTAIVIDELIQELTKEYQMTTIVITHDMNSVLEIGENILFIDGGVKMWEGNKEEILDVKVKELYDFVYVSKFLQKMKK